MKEIPVKFSNVETRCPEMVQAKEAGKEFRWSFVDRPHYKLFVVDRSAKKYCVSCGRQKLYIKEN